MTTKQHHVIVSQRDVHLRSESWRDGGREHAPRGRWGVTAALGNSQNLTRRRSPRESRGAGKAGRGAATGSGGSVGGCRGQQAVRLLLPTTATCRPWPCPDSQNPRPGGPLTPDPPGLGRCEQPPSTVASFLPPSLQGCWCLQLQELGAGRAWSPGRHPGVPPPPQPLGCVVAVLSPKGQDVGRNRAGIQPPARSLASEETPHRQPSGRRASPAPFSPLGTQSPPKPPCPGQMPERLQAPSSQAEVATHPVPGCLT